MENMKVGQVRDLIEQKGREMYAQALSDLMSEIKLKKADGFVIDELIVLEILEGLARKNKQK